MKVDDSFELSLELAEFTSGDESPSSTYEIDIEGTQVSYHGPIVVHPRGHSNTVSETFQLTPAQRSRLAEIIDEYDLRQSVSETYEPEGFSPYFDRIDASATLTIDGETFDLQIRGAVYDAGTPTDMVHFEQASGLRTLCKECEDWTEAHV